MKTSVYIVLFLVFFNAGGFLYTEAGVDDYLGVEFTTGDNPELERAEQQANSVSDQASGAIDGTLIGLYNTVTGILATIFNAINPGAAMLKAAVASPTFDLLVNFSFAGMWVVTGITLVEFLRGVQLS
jgi:hypothetical protein